MPASAKQKLLDRFLAVCGERYDVSIPDDLTVMDHLVVAILQEGTTFGTALKTYRKLREDFCDLNELRVSHRREVEDRLSHLPDGEAKAKRLLDALQFVFETTYTYDLEVMKKKPLKQATKQLSKIAGTDPYITAATVQRSLGGHAVPVDARMFGTAKQVGLVDAEESLEDARASLEHLVPKAQGVDFCLELSELAADENRQSAVDVILDDRIALPKPAPKRKAKAAAKAKPGDDKPNASKSNPKAKAAKRAPRNDKSNG